MNDDATGGIDSIPRSARFRPGGPGAPPPPLPLTDLPPAPVLRFTPASDSPGTDRDVLLGYQLFLGRDPENSFVIASARANPLHGMIRGWITSDEFTNAILTPLEAGRPLPHETGSSGPDADQIAWLMRHLDLDPISRAAVQDAMTWRDLLQVLVRLPGFPRPHAAGSGAAASEGAAGEAQPGFILITIEQPRPGEAAPGSHVEGSGWVIAPSDVTEISVHAGGALLTQARFGLPRPDVARRFPHYRKVDHCGFAFSAGIPASPEAPDNLSLTILVRTAGGEVGRKAVRLRPPAQAAAAVEAAASRGVDAAASPVIVAVQTPQADAAPLLPYQALAVSGWAVARGGLARVDLFLDDTALGAAHTGIRRTDIAAAFADYPASLMSGWTLVIPPQHVTPGAHRLRVVAVSARGDTAEQILALSVDPALPAHLGLRQGMPPGEAAFGLRLLERQPTQPHFTVFILSGSEDAALQATQESLNLQIYRRVTQTILSPTDAADLPDDGFPEPGAGREKFVIRLRAGDRLGCDALLELAICGIMYPDAGLIYADELRADPRAGALQPLAKPDFSPELLLGTNIIGRAWCARLDVVRKAGFSLAALAAAADYDVVLRLAEAAENIAHAPKLLLQSGSSQDTPTAEEAALAAAMARRRMAAFVMPGPVPRTWRTRRRHAAIATSSVRVSIIMPTCGAHDLVKRAIASIRETAAAPPVEIVLIDHTPAKAKTLRTWLRKRVEKLLPAEGSFNWSRFCNEGARAASGDVLLFLNDDVEATTEFWLEPMLEQALRPEVGVVGAKLLYPDGRIQHAGMFLADNHARHAFRYSDGEDPGPFGLAAVTREVAAVTGACLMVRRDVFDRLGGFDEAHGVINNDVDFCLRARRAGLSVIYTPHASLLHHELASRAAAADDFDSGRFLQAFGREFAAGDPYRTRQAVPRSDHFAYEPEPAAIIHAGRAVMPKHEVRKIIAVTLGGAEDFLDARLALNHLKTQFPQAALTLLAPPAVEPLASLETSVDAFEPFAFFNTHGLPGAGDSERAALQTRLAAQHYDLAIDLHVQPETRIVLRHTGARILAGFDHAGRFGWLNVALEWEGNRPLQAKRAPAAERLLQLAAAAAAAFAQPPPLRPVTPEAAEAALRHLPPAFRSRFVCVQPGAGRGWRRWPASSFASLIELLLQDQDTAIVLIGEAGDEAAADRLLALMQPGTQVVSLAGRLDAAETAALLQRCTLLVGNDSAPLHIAAGLGVPTVAVQGGMIDAHEAGPVGAAALSVQRQMRCGPCYIGFADECPRALACLTGLLPRDVFDICRRALALGHVPPAPADETPIPRQAPNDTARQLQPAADGPQGYIEAVAAGGAGQHWVVGWMKPGSKLDFPVAVADGTLHPGNLAIMTFERPNLPAGAHGIVGLLNADWQPRLNEVGEAEEFLIFYGEGGRFHLRCHMPLRLITTATLAAEYQDMLERCGHALMQSPSLQPFLGVLESWQPSRPGGAWMGTATSIDSILFVPGLGCLVEGWVLSPLWRIEALRLRVGGVMMAARPNTLAWKPRPDLIAGYPGSETMAARAGFVGLFAGEEEPTDFIEPILKLVFEGGKSVNWAIPPKVFRRLGQSAGLDAAKTYFPALEEEAFFPQFAVAASRAERALIAPPVLLQVTPASRVLVLVLPPDRCDLFLLFEEVSSRLRPAAPDGPVGGVVFVASDAAGRSDALWLFREFRAEVPLPTSLLTIAEPAHAWALLPDILACVGAQRFLFLYAGVFLTDAGWAQVPRILGGEPASLVCLADADARPGARCFGWSAEALAHWAQAAPCFLGGFYADNGLGAASPAIVPSAIRTSRPLPRNRLQDAVNAVVAQDRQATHA
jgi:ADP-heptose:LPS heptosyltransferase/GT2 family glycosyltransferase